MRRVFVDANIVIDLLCERHPLVSSSVAHFQHG